MRAHRLFASVAGLARVWVSFLCALRSKGRNSSPHQSKIGIAGDPGCAPAFGREAVSYFHCALPRPEGRSGTTKDRALSRVANSQRACTTACIAILLIVSSCERETRRFQEGAPSTDTSQSHVSMGDLYPGGTKPPSNVVNIYEENAYATSEGKRLYEQYNCVGCHFHGGGGIGPPLMDPDWIYGSEPQNVHDTIIEGRPNGMPSFRGKIPDQQVWEIVAYVRSLSGQVRKDVAPSRSDSMYYKRPEQSQKREQPHEERPQ